MAALASLLFLAPSTAWPLTIEKDTVWSGTVDVEGQVVVEKWATLKVAPGTIVRLARGKQDSEGLSDSGILVNGNIVAEGTPGARITITSDEEVPAPGDWGEIKVFESPGSSFTDCDFRYGGWGLHLHESDLKVKGCTFSDMSFGGLRGKAGNIEVSGSTFSDMEIGIRYWKGSPSIHNNTITRNVTGIFLRQECGQAKINYNNIQNNFEYNVKLGDAQTEDVNLMNNWWGTKRPAAVRRKIYDKGRDAYIGRAVIKPLLKKEVDIH